MQNTLDLSYVYNKIINSVTEYLIKYNIKGIAIGISGGLDSAVNTFIFSQVCKQLNIKLIGRYIHIESNSIEEQYRAQLFGYEYCTNFRFVDLTNGYYNLLNEIEEENEYYITDNVELTIQDERKMKIRRGNIKARMRMIYLYNIAQFNECIVADNDNLTERLLGFWTLHGDVGDITPLADLWKTDVFALAKYIMENKCEHEGEKTAFQLVIDALPTDGLGITASDVDQFGAKSYDEVDDVLKPLINITTDEAINEKKCELEDKYTPIVINNIWSRHLNSEFKRNHPYRIKINK